LQSVNLVLLPKVARLFAANQLVELQGQVSVAVVLTSTFAFSAFLIFFFWGEHLIEILFGEPYIRSFDALLIIGLGQLISSLVGSVVLILNMTGHEKETFKGAIGFTFSNIVLNLALIPLYGIEGAALATTLCLVSLNFYLYFVTKRVVGVNPSVIGLRPSKF